MPHPGAAHGALRRRANEWERSNTDRWRSALERRCRMDAWRSRGLLAIDLTTASSWMRCISGGFQWPELASVDADLQQVLGAWPSLADPIRRAVMALIQSAK